MNTILRVVTKLFETGAPPGEWMAATPCDDLDIVTDIPYQNYQHVPLAMDLYRPKYRSTDALLLDYGKGKHLIHAFPALNPYLPESVDAMSRILQWFASK